MGKRPRNKMPVSERAKQFSPFAAVVGLDKALAEAEKEFFYAERAELSEEAAEKLNKALTELKKGDKAQVRYYRDGEYLTVIGQVSGIDEIKRTLKIGDIYICFEDLCRIEAVV